MGIYIYIYFRMAIKIKMRICKRCGEIIDHTEENSIWKHLANGCGEDVEDEDN